jgi:hypothetical protein
LRPGCLRCLLQLFRSPHGLEREIRTGPSSDGFFVVCFGGSATCVRGSID